MPSLNTLKFNLSYAPLNYTLKSGFVHLVTILFLKIDVGV